MKQAKQLGIDIPFYGNSALSTDDMTRLAGDAANGLHLLLVFHPVVNKEMAEFFKRYQAKFGAAPEVFAVNSYISATMLMDILAKQYPNITRASVKDGLDAVRKIDSIAGPLTYDPATREWDFQFHRGMIKDGQFVLVTK
jgi:branched-chain amino acid transport system substrate-binding protein